jgi:hypothetical protein
MQDTSFEVINLATESGKVDSYDNHPVASRVRLAQFC